MGRNKYKQPLDKFDRKRVKNGDATTSLRRNVNDERQQKYKLTDWGEHLDIMDTRGLAKRRGPRHRQTSNNWVHAVLFCVLVVIVVSWALGY